MKSEKHIELLNEFKERLDEDRFYDAHESLEEIWFPRRFEDNDEVKLLKGFINAAVSFELIKKGRIESSNKVWGNYLKYKPLIEKVDSKYLQDYKRIILHVEKIKEQLNINLRVV
jgi:hypothetical protein